MLKRHLFTSFRFYSKEHQVMTPFSKNPITFIWRLVAMLYITSVTCDSVEKITIRTYS